MLSRLFRQCTLSFVFFALLASCADPKYVKEYHAPAGLDNGKGQEVDCRVTFSESRLCLTWYWEKQPIDSNDEGILIFKTYRLNAIDKSAVEVDMPSTPRVVLWMSSMNHGSQPTETTRVEVGTYRAKQVFFIMAGEWQLKFQLKDGDTVRDEAVVEFVF